MNPILLSPHNDDETLFAGYLVMRFRPHVLVVFKSTKQNGDGITALERENETERALAHLLREHFQWTQGALTDYFPSTREAAVREALRAHCLELRETYDHCFAPAWEEGGHDQHNLVAEVALDVWGDESVTQYLTYRRGYARTRSEWQVPFESWWPVAKLRAMSCYTTQISLPATAPWFCDSTLHEYLAHAPKIPYPPDPGGRLFLPLAHHEKAAVL